VYAALYNLYQLALMFNVKGKFHGDFSFLGVNGKYPLPNTLPEGIIRMFQDQIGGDYVLIVNLGKKDTAGLALPSDISGLWKPGRN
jgi:hypothetical protein